jgi:hypothetical protein
VSEKRERELAGRRDGGKAPVDDAPRSSILFSSSLTKPPQNNPKTPKPHPNTPQTGFSAQPIFTTMTISTFNMIFTACPVVAYAVLESDVEPSVALQNPAVYSDSRLATRRSFFARWIATVYGLGTWHAFPAYFAAWYTLGVAPSASGDEFGLVATGTAVFVALITVVALRLAVVTHRWSWVTHLIYWLSWALLLPFIAALSYLWTSAPGGGPSVSGVADMTGVAGQLFRSPVFWLVCLVLAPAAALLPDLAWAAGQRQARPTLAQLLQEQEALERARRRREGRAARKRAKASAAAARRDEGGGGGGGGLGLGRLIRRRGGGGAGQGGAAGGGLLPLHGGSRQQQRGGGGGGGDDGPLPAAAGFATGGGLQLAGRRHGSL